METVVTAVIILFIVLFAVLTLSYAFISAQDGLHVSWQDMEHRLAEQERTALSTVDAHTAGGGVIVELTLRNVGSTRLADFEQWDAILEYYDAGSPAGRHIGWMPFTSSPAVNQWSVAGFYLDALQDTGEAFEPGILNPDEEMVLRFQVSPAVAQGTAVRALIAPQNGAATSTIFTGNLPPTLVKNEELFISSGETDLISRRTLEVSDGDDPIDSLIFTVTTPPAQGSLNLVASFTQADINGGLLSYTHTGSGDDSFTFTVSDGKDTIGAYVFAIAVNIPPSLETNAGLNVPTGGSGAVGDLLLKVIDEDNTPETLMYRIVAPPTQGTLSKDYEFTQAEINEGALNYTHTGSGADSFQFTISDGKAIIGPFTFTITPY